MYTSTEPVSAVPGSVAHQLTERCDISSVNIASLPQTTMLFSVLCLRFFPSSMKCAMCSGACYWAGIRNVVFGCREEKLTEITDKNREKVCQMEVYYYCFNPFLQHADGGLCVPCRLVFGHAQADINVIGPLCEDEAATEHEKYWI